MVNIKTFKKFIEKLLVNFMNKNYEHNTYPSVKLACQYYESKSIFKKLNRIIFIEFVRFVYIPNLIPIFNLVIQSFLYILKRIWDT